MSTEIFSKIRGVSSSSGGPEGGGGGDGEGSLCIGTSAIRDSAISTSISCKSARVCAERKTNDKEVDAWTPRRGGEGGGAVEVLLCLWRAVSTRSNFSAS